jgi:hypothetical protein
MTPGLPQEKCIIGNAAMLFFKIAVSGYKRSNIIPKAFETSSGHSNQKKSEA